MLCATSSATETDDGAPGTQVPPLAAHAGTMPRATRIRADWRRRHAKVLPPHHRTEHELIQPPALAITTPAITSNEEDSSFDAVAIQQRLGIQGSVDNTAERSIAIEDLALNGSTPRDIKVHNTMRMSKIGAHESRRAVDATELCCKLHMLHGARMLADRRWCSAYIRATESTVAAASRSTPSPRVIVLGLGTGVPALAAARAGAEVVWFVRVARFGDVAQYMVERNGLAGRIKSSYARGGSSRRAAALASDAGWWLASGGACRRDRGGR